MTRYFVTLSYIVRWESVKGFSDKKMTPRDVEVSNFIFLSVAKQLTKMGKFSYLHFTSKTWRLKLP